MYKCRVVYDEWKSMIKKHREGSFENSSDFKGYVGLLSIEEVSQKQEWKYKDETITVCDNGYKWLTIMPKDDYYCITVMMDSDYNIKVSYIDMIDSQGIDDDGVPFFYDCYLDLVVYPDGYVKVDDRDELDEALQNGDISKEQYDRALQTADKLRQTLFDDYEKYLSFIKGRLRLFANTDNTKLPERLERTTIYESDYVCLYTDKVRLPSGHIIDKYHQIHYPHESVVIVIFNEKKEILMIREKRYTVQRLEWEVPAGRIEDGETKEDAARREAMEETGCTLKNLKFLCTQNPANGMSDCTLHVFAAKVDSENSIQDVDEVAYKQWMPISQVKELLRNNETKDGVSILAILFALQFYEY